MKKRIVFMGTPVFSVKILEALAKIYEVVLVVSQPDKEIGRKKILTSSPVKNKALSLGIKVFTPQKIREDNEIIVNLKPDMIVTCAYGQIIPISLLEVPSYGSINVHASLLPKLRGGAPIQRAIIEGANETGITIMYMNEFMDEGDILASKSIPIEENDNLSTLEEKLSILGMNLLIETMPLLFEKKITPLKQNSNEATYAHIIKREDEHLDFSTKTTKELYNQIRGLITPGAYVLLNNQEFKIYEAFIKEEKHQELPGTIVSLYKDGIGVATINGELVLKDIKPFGKKRMSAKDYLNGIDKEALKGSLLK